jgi:hypothetical protein
MWIDRRMALAGGSRLAAAPRMNFASRPTRLTHVQQIAGVWGSNPKRRPGMRQSHATPAKHFPGWRVLMLRSAGSETPSLARQACEDGGSPYKPEAQAKALTNPDGVTILAGFRVRCCR